MEQLNNTINRLNQYPNKSVTVINLDTGAKIVCNRKGSALIEEFGSVEAFFESIYKQGITKIRVSDRNPSGSSSTPDGEPYNVSLTTPGATNEPTEVKHKTAVLEDKKPPIMPGLNGGDFSSVGMNAAQIDVAGKLFDYPRIFNELQTTRLELERIKGEYQDLKLKVSVSEAVAEKSARQTEANAGLLAAGKDLVKEGLGAFMMLKGNMPASPPGLAGIDGFSQSKQRVVALLKNIEDDNAHYLGNLIEKWHEPEIWKGFEELLTKNDLA